MSVWADAKSSFETISSTRVFPAASHGPSTTLLSISDANKANWGQAAATWFFDAPSQTPAGGQDVAAHLQKALSYTLDAYPQYCGQLQMLPYSPQAGTKHVQRYGRLQLVHGAPTDPGVLFNVATCPQDLAALVPSPADRSKDLACWNIQSLDDHAWFPAARIANPVAKETDPSDHPAHVQITRFACGGTAVAIKITHACADANSLVRFAVDYARVSRALLKGESLPKLTPIFNTAQVDGAAGDIDAAEPDAAKVALANNLPSLRYDSWIGLPGQVPAELETHPAASQPSGDMMPWAEWDFAKPVSHTLVHFSPAQVDALWKTASAATSTKITHQDALVGHLWARISAARGLATENGLVHCNMMLGFRARLPGLSEDTAGAPFLMASGHASPAEICGSDASAATAIRAAIAAFTPAAIGAQLHAWAYELSPQRVWQYFCGTRNLVVTSWMRVGVNDVDFGISDKPARLVRANMPSVDGSLQVHEGASQGEHSGTNWHETGIDVSVHIATEATEKLLKDPLLFPRDS